jgi:hypothetical protein
MKSQLTMEDWPFLLRCHGTETDGPQNPMGFVASPGS